MRPLYIVVIIFLVVVNLMVKFLHFGDPYFGAYIFRQLQTMSTIDAYVYNGIDIFHPRTNFAGWPGYYILECPLFQAFTAGISHLTGGDALLVTRVINLILGGLTIFFVYRIALLWFDRQAALYSSLFFAFAPTNLMFHRSTLIDVSSVFLSIVSFYLLLGLLKKEKAWWKVILFLITSMMSGLIKPLYLFPHVVILLKYLLEKSYPFSAINFRKAIREHFVILMCFALDALAILGWMKSIGSSHSAHVMQHLGVSAMFNPGYYLNIVLRLFRQCLNPLTVLFAVIGYLKIWQGSRSKDPICLFVIPVLYYVIFADINLPHTYYSLIMVPFFSMAAGLGAAWLETCLCQSRLIKNAMNARVMIYVLSSGISVLLFFSNLTEFMVLPFQRYKNIAKEVSGQLDPVQYSIVYVNRDAHYEVYEYLRNRPKDYIATFLRGFSDEELKGEATLDHPLVRSAVLYALKQYGKMEYLHSNFQLDIPKEQDAFHHELRYVLFYLFDNKNRIYTQMSPLKPVYETPQWVVYDVSPAS